MFMLNFLTKSLALEISNFLKFLKNMDIAQKTFTKSAFVQARKKIKPEVFCHLNEELVKEFYTDNPGVKTAFNGLRILSVDGSRLTLPLTKELEKIYGKSKNQTDTHLVQAKVSVLYDVLNKICLGGILSPLNVDERMQAKELLRHCSSGDLLIYDRGYPSFDLIYSHYQSSLDFIIRTRLDFSSLVKDFVQSGKHSQIVDMYPGKNIDLKGKEYNKSTSVKVRLIRITLSSGETEVLITSLLDSREYANDIFKELYFQRWKIESYYDELKNKLRIEEFSGYSNQTILQDFYSMLLVSNIQTLIVEELNEELQNEQGNKKYCYKINSSLSYGLMKDRVIGILLDKKDMDEGIMELKQLFKEHLIPIRPDRSNKRNVGKYRNRIKPIITKNQKDSL